MYKCHCFAYNRTSYYTPFINKILQSETKKKLKDRNVPIETGSCVTKATLNMIQCSTRNIAIKVFQYCLISVCRHLFHAFLNSILLPNFTAYPLIVVRQTCQSLSHFSQMDTSSANSIQFFIRSLVEFQVKLRSIKTTQTFF